MWYSKIRRLQKCSRSDSLCGSEERAHVKSGDVVGDESRGTKAMVEDFHLNLAAMRVTSERKFDAQFGGAIERIRIVGQQNVGGVLVNQRLDARKHQHLPAAGSTFALIIHAD